MAGLARQIGAFSFFVIAGLSVSHGSIQAPRDERPAVPATLHETGLYQGETGLDLAPGHLGFAPQYPLWSDGASKRRWISLPQGTRIDARDPDAWVFPAGTRFWKEFSLHGRRVETRYMERRADGGWTFAAYAWRDDQREADLVGVTGRRNAYALGEDRFYSIPGVAQCEACHLGGGSAVLGFAALQLSPDRDPNALHAEPAPSPGVTLAALVERGLIEGLDPWPRRTAPRMPAAGATERAALGYLHGNCGHCHNDRGPLARLGLHLHQPVMADRAIARATTFGADIVRPPAELSAGTRYRIEPGHPALSGLVQRIASRHPSLQMPPLATSLVDAEAVELITRWIAEAGMVPARDRQITRSTYQ